MTLLDPKNIDVADVLSLIRDIGNRLDGISGRLADISEQLDSIEEDSIERTGRIEDDTAEITCKLSMMAQLLAGASPDGRAGMSTGPNGEPGDRDLAVQTRDASRRLRALASLCNDLCDELLSTGPRPGSAQRLYDLACDARDLSRTLVMLERQRDNQENEPEET